MGSECNSDNLVAFSLLLPYPEPPPPPPSSSSGISESPSLLPLEPFASSRSPSSVALCFDFSRRIQKNMAARANTIVAGMLRPSIIPSFFFLSLAWLSPVVVFPRLLEEVF